MPLKSGGSHAFGTFLGLLLGSILSGFVSAYAGALAWHTGHLVTTYLPITLSEPVAGILLITVTISFVWGVVYHFIRF